MAAWISSSAKCGQAVRGTDAPGRFDPDAGAVSGVPFVVMIFVPLGVQYRDRMMTTARQTSSAGILPAVPRASRPRRGGRGRPPDSRRDGGATLSDNNSADLLLCCPLYHERKW